MSVPAHEVTPELDRSPDLDIQVAKLHRLAGWTRWLFVMFSWLTIGWWSLWELRESIVLLSEYFSWAGVVYGYYFHLGAGCGLLMCLLFTCSSIVWQISHTVGGLSARERHQLELKVNQIQEKGSRHWLWHWIQIK
jgi:hypothetical protein